MLHNNTLSVFIRLNMVLILGLSPTFTCVAATAYRWTDAAGQEHYGDRPPAGSVPKIIIPGAEAHEQTGSTGLRPGERVRLDAIKQRQQEYQRRARSARSHTDRQRRQHAQQCKDHRQQLKSVRGPDAYKEHARFLRNNCW